GRRGGARERPRGRRGRRGGPGGFAWAGGAGGGGWCNTVAPARPPPFVTVAMPSFNEERYIEVCLRSVLGQDYPADRLEVLVADGRSTDRTREIVTRIAADDARVVLVDNSQRLQAAGMNEAIRPAP